MGCVKLHILDEQCKRTELTVSNINKELTSNFCAENTRRIVRFGEVFVEERNNKWNTPYLFNAKELDEETGLYYYGARYYDPRVSVWLGVDKDWEKYINISVYTFCHDNPEKLTDPNGKGDYYDSFTGEKVYNDKKDDGKVYIRQKESYKITQYTGSSSGSSSSVIKIPQSDTYVGLKSEIPDKTKDLITAMQKTQEYFSKKNSEFSAKESNILRWFGIKYDRMKFFYKEVTNYSPFDLKRVDGPFNINNNGNFKDGYGFYDSKLLRFDDFGNINFGVAAKAFGIPEKIGEIGAGIRQLLDSFRSNSPVGDISTFFDDEKDNYMIKQGYKYYDKNFKK